jgi:predicted ArsR family transcriptional regulator
MAAGKPKPISLQSTRGQIVRLLRHQRRTVGELARALDLTANAVRVHLGTLERDGYVRAGAVRRDGGVGKPATVFEVAPESEPSLSSAYVPVLTTLVRAIAERRGTRELRTLMRDVGHRLAAAHGGGAGTTRARAKLAARLLNELGAETVVERRGGVLRIRGRACPLSAAVAEQPEVCGAVRVLVGDVAGVSVREHCDRSGRPQCCFELEEA